VNAPALDDLAGALRDARARTGELILDVTDAPGTSAMRWEVGHLAWFLERWVLGSGADARYAAALAAEERGGPGLPDMKALLARADEALKLGLAALRGAEGPALGALAALAAAAVVHEDLHGESIACTRHVLSFPEPRWTKRSTITRLSPAGAHPGDVAIPGGQYWLGALPGTRDFVLDDEKWAHPVSVRPYLIARAPVTNDEYARYVEATRVQPPPHWTRSRDGWRSRRWDKDEPLAPYQPVVHVSWHDAEAYCHWAGRRLPTEAEWELAASSYDKRRMPWGDAPDTRAHANLDARAGRLVDVALCPDGDSPYGCRQMIGNVWEWTASRFARYPGWSGAPEASAPRTERAAASTHMVLRGGSWLTRGRSLRTTSREPQPPHRRDLFAGFRTCAV
jgi:iron(II)-dependent oxidoreductase